MSERIAGVVAEFDAHVGLGVVASSNGDSFPFHCTQIANGSRTIDVGASVTFVVVDRFKGPEAYEIEPVH
jgi:CspA family cold shock protein